MEYKYQLLFLVIILLFSYRSVAQVSFGEPVNINDQWKFELNDVEGVQEVDFDDEKWQSIDLPHDWSVEQHLSPTLASAMGYLPGGIGWYRKSINIPEERRGEKVFLYFEGVYNRSEVYINGHLLGKRPNGYISFMYDATPYIKPGKDNVIAVRVDHSRDADSRWYTGSGIYRDVWMVYANPVHIAQWGVFAYPENVNTKQGTLKLAVEIKNESEENSNLIVRHELVSPEGKVVGKSDDKLLVPAREESKVSLDIKVRNLQLWSIDSPDLYRLKTSLLKDGKVIDETITTMGFRSLTFDPDKGFALNENWMKVKGVCLHHDAGVLGSAVPREVWKRRLLTLKEIGVNAIRTSHNPQAPDLYELCDELGMLVLNEAFDEWKFPKRKWLEGWNVGTPGFEGSFDFFEEWAEQDLADMVRRDRNHISIFAWSIGNEVDYPNDPYSHPVLDGNVEDGFTQPIFGGYKKDAPDATQLGTIAKKLVAVVKSHDTSRPVTAGLAGVAMSNETEYPSALDITGYNYTEKRYASDHEKYPGRVIFGSENRHDLKAWEAVTENDHIFGQFLWTGIDYLGESGRWPSRGFYSGLLDFGGFIKPRGYFRQSLWSDKPMAYIGTYPASAAKGRNRLSIDAWPIWNYDEDQTIRVVCYTNASKARLELNGEVVGETKNYDQQTGVIHWDIPFRQGKLEVIGLDESNNEIARYAIQTSQAPHAISIISGEKEISKDGGLAQIAIQVVDENGIPVMLSDNEVACQIDGPAELLGLEASNNRDMSDYTDNEHRVYHGRMLAYIKATGEEGKVNVKFTSPWLEPVEMTIDVR
ncbi:DUF4982 domain-containing protein [Galbibacter sp. EGI 63066]|uniref:sugar-binding domain-containing protein n=1 Tax=Galbibacter sp. EGI 63066 TaxID=2993559 RepID=UPI00224953E9|nr:sugar-binding domain-containing protein [Galbibacter sp. EGI 63066]MCX2679785.1 DUF4982 domain-containing protein [Galbibacter sp. EGI 63066]